MLLAAHAEAHVVLGRGDGGRAGADEDDLDVVDLLADDLERIQQRRARDDRRAVLVVVEHGDGQRLAEALLDVEASGDLMSSRLMPPKVGSSSWQKRISLGVLGVDLQVEHVDVGEALEQQPLPSMTGLRRAARYCPGRARRCRW